MTNAAEELISLAAKLPPSERLRLVESILATLGKPDTEIAMAWANEVQDRLAAYHVAKIAAVSEEEVFGYTDDIVWPDVPADGDSAS